MLKYNMESLKTFYQNMKKIVSFKNRLCAITKALEKKIKKNCVFVKIKA